MARTRRALDLNALWWTIAGLAASAVIIALVIVAPLAAVAVVAGGIFLWSFTWKVERFFAAHFGLALVALMAVPLLRLTSAENNLRIGVAALLVATAVAVALRVKIAPPGALVGLTLVFFILGFIATSTVEDDNQWLFYALELLVAGAAMVFAAAAAKLRAWPTVAKIIIFATAAEATLALFEVMRLNAPLWRGGRILTDGTSTWMRNEVLASIPRAQGTLGHPLPLAFVLVIGALLVIRTKTFPKFLRLLIFPLLGAGVFVSGSRNAIILFVALSVLALALPKITQRLPVFVLLGLAGLAAAAPFLFNKFEQIVTTGSVFHRVGALESIGSLINDRGTLTVLIGDGSAASPRLYAEGLLQSDGLAAVDNQYVLTLAQNGVLGLGLLIIMIIAAFRKAPATLRVLLLAVTITGMIFDLFAWPVIGFIVWFIIAGCFARMPNAGTNTVAEGRKATAPQPQLLSTL